jgi:thymidylate synthase
MFNIDEQYLGLLEDILTYGEIKGDRTGTGTISLFGPQIECNLEHGFPLLTTKKLHIPSIVYELLWFLKGDHNIRYLNENKVKIWNDDAYRWHKTQHPNSTMSKERYLEVIMQGNYDYIQLGSLGPVYGVQWRKWLSSEVGYLEDNEYPLPVVIDQVADVIEQIRNNPDSRRLVVSAWNPAEIDKMALPPCHILYQFYVSNGYLSCKMYQRSADVFLGVPFNIASYALLTHLVAKMTGLKPGRLILTFGDAHIYTNHIEQVKEQLNRKPKPLPTIEIKTVRDKIEDYTFDDIEISGYTPHPLIKGKLSVGE